MGEVCCLKSSPELPYLRRDPQIDNLYQSTMQMHQIIMLTRYKECTRTELNWSKNRDGSGKHVSRSCVCPPSLFYSCKPYPVPVLDQPYPIPDQHGKNLYSILEQKDSKTISFNPAHTYMADYDIGKYKASVILKAEHSRTCSISYLA